MADKIQNNNLTNEQSFRDWQKEFNEISRAIIRDANRQQQALNSLLSAQQSRFDAVIGQMQSVQRGLKGYSANTTEAAKATDNLTKEFFDLTKQAKQLESNSDAVRRVQRESGKSVEAYQKEIKRLTKEFKKLDQAEEKNEKKAQALAAEVRQLKTASSNLSSALKVNRIQALAAAGSYDELNQRQKQLLKTIKAAENGIGGNSKQLAALKKEYSENNQKLKDFDSGLGIHNRNVGNYQSALKGAIGKLGGVAAAFGVAFIGLQALTSGLKFAISKFTDFEFTMAKVRAVSGASEQQFQALSENAKELGASTQFTTSQVGELQLVLSKLGYQPEQILNMTAATLDLAAATGEDLAKSAEVAGSIIRGFGLRAEDSTRVTDVMAKSFSSSALDLEKFNESMKDAAPFAASAGVSLEATTAALGQLANRSISGSRAGTAMKNILIELQNENSKLSKFLGFSVKSTEDFEKALIELNKRQIDATQATALVGKISAGSLKILADGAPEVLKLGQNFKNAAGSAASMAATMRNTLRGSLDSAQSAMEGLAINIGNALSPAIKSAVDGFTSFVQGLNSLLFGAKKTKDAFDILAEATDEINKQFAKESHEASVLFRQLQTTTEGSEAYNAAKKELDRLYGSILKNYQDEEGSLIDIDAAQKAVIASIKERITLEVNQKKIAQALSQQQKDQTQSLTNLSETYKDYIKGIEVGELNNLVNALSQVGIRFDRVLSPDQINRIAKVSGDASRTVFKLQDAFKGNLLAADAFTRVINPLVDSSINLDTTIKNLTKTTDTQGKVSKKVAKESEKASASQASSIDLATQAIKNQIKEIQLQTQLREKEIEHQILLQQRALDAAGNDLFKRSVILRELQKLQVERVNTVADANIQIEKLEERATKTSFIFQQQRLANDKNAAQKSQELILKRDIALKTSANKQLQIEQDRVNQALKINADFAKKLSEQSIKLSGISTLKEINDERRDLLLNASKSALQIAGEEFEAREKQAEKFANRRLQIEQELARKRIDLLKEVFSFAQELTNIAFEQDIQQKELDLERLEEQKEKELELAGDNEAQKVAITEKFAKKEEQIQEEINQQKRKQFIANKAFNAAQIVIDTATAIMATLKQGGALAIPLALSVGAIGALQLGAVLAQPVPQFAEGTEYLQLDGAPKGTDTIPALYKGRTPVMLDEGERILSKKHNKLLSGYSNQDIVDIVQLEKKAQIAKGAASVVSNTNNISISTKGLERLQREQNRKLSRIENAIYKTSDSKELSILQRRNMEDELFRKRRN